MDVSFFKDKRVTVFGLGMHGGGVGTVKFLVKHGAKVIVTDIKTKTELAESISKLEGLKNITYVLGQHRVEDFTKTDMVIKTPAAPWTNKHIKLALEKKIPVEVDSSLFFKLCKRPIIGVTGTKGKTTISELIYHILKTAGKSPVKVGVSQTAVLDKIDDVRKDSIVVFELSSWRLSAIGRIQKSPHIAVFKNLYPDHLNYYKSIESYIEDKKNIYKYQTKKDYLVANVDDEVVRSVAEEAVSQVVKISRNPVETEPSVFLRGDEVILKDKGEEKVIINVNDIPLPGAHNQRNVLAASAACYTAGVSAETIRKAIKSFKGVAHRLEFVREIGGVKYYNDTAATVPQAAVNALNSFSAPIYLIVGGTDKGGLNYEQLSKLIIEKAKGVVFLKGSATDNLIRQIKKDLPEDMKDVQFTIVDTMGKAVEFVYRVAEEGDIVLLSPGAASFGLFANEFDRGRQFREIVRSL